MAVRTALFACALVMGIQPAAACAGAQASADEPVRVRLGYFANVTHAPALVGLDEGLFEGAVGPGAVVEPMLFNAGPSAVEAMFAEGLDITYIGPTPAVNAFQKSHGEAVRVISGSTSGGASLVVQPGIDDASDLEGEVIASPQLGGTQDVALRSWLADHGLEADTTGGGEVSVRPQQNADTLAAFTDGRIAAAWVPEPWASRLVLEGGGVVLVDERSLWPQGRFVTTQILVRTEFLAEHPGVVRDVLAAHLDALELIGSDPERARAAADRRIEADSGKALPAGISEAAWGSLEFTHDPLADTLRRSAVDAHDVDLLDDTDVEGIYDLEPLNDLLAERGLAEVQP